MRIPKLLRNFVHKLDYLMISGFLSLSQTSGRVLFNSDGSIGDFTSPSVRQKMTTEKKNQKAFNLLLIVKLMMIFSQ